MSFIFFDQNLFLYYEEDLLPFLSVMKRRSNIYNNFQLMVLPLKIMLIPTRPIHSNNIEADIIYQASQRGKRRFVVSIALMQDTTSLVLPNFH